MKEIIKEIKNNSSKKRKETNERFFKTGPGEYGYGDKFIGASMPDIRIIVKKYHKRTSYNEIKKLLDSPIHEIRMTGLLILKEKYKEEQKKAYDFYIKNIKSVNNWDLVDCTTPQIIGDYMLKNKEERKKLYEWTRSKNLWVRRISIIATSTLIRKGEIKECLKISKILLNDKEDLIHKAVGWMLREAWKKQEEEVESFLKENYEQIPRTTLRYAIEKMKETKRKKFLKGKIK